MKRRNLGGLQWVTPVILAGSLLNGWSDADLSRYNTIVERNPFGLKPPPPPPDPNLQPPPPPPAPLATVELTGITSILSSKRALLEIIPGPGKPMLKPILSEGEKLESIEVVSINVEKNEVVIKNGGLVTNLTFKVAKSAPTPLPGINPTLPIPNRPGMVPPAIPGSVPQTSFTPRQSSGGRSGVIMTGGAPAYEAPAAFNSVNPTHSTGDPAAAAALQNNLSSGFRSIPSRSIRSGLPQQQNTAPPPMSAEEQVIHMEVNRQLNPPSFPPLPPTPLTPHLPPLPGQ